MRAKYLAICLLILLLFACSGGSQTIELADTGDVLEPISEIHFVDGGIDLQVDIWLTDISDGGLGLDQTTKCTEPGGFACSCQENTDCNSGFCVQHLGELVCTTSCVEECPGSGWSCTEYSGFGDPVFICLSDATNLCWPCASDADCKANGTNDVCVNYGDEGNFCGSDCSDQDPCPAGYKCDLVTTLSGLDVSQCVPTNGPCECTTFATAQEAWTPCGEANEWGNCAGKRLCAKEGLQPCDAPIPSEEICNGIDDDCDGQVDGALCDDGSPCTEDSCEGEEGCKHVAAPDGAECIDGDLCTLQDQCADGLCVGAPVECMDDNPCTSEECDPTTGDCVFPPDTEANGAVCGAEDKCMSGGLCVDGACVGSEPLSCFDGIACTLADCDPEVGCLLTLDHDSCDDGADCTEDLCQPDCDLDGNCLEGSGCIHGPTADGSLCDDGEAGVLLACNAGECTCVTQCDGKVCGENGCGGECGVCNFPTDLCTDDGSACIGQPCVDSSACGPGLYCDKTQDPAQCLPGCDVDMQCISQCGTAGPHVCLGNNSCLCATGDWAGFAQLPAEDGCVMSSEAFCLTADSVDPMAPPQGGAISASGKYRIETTLWQ